MRAFRDESPHCYLGIDPVEINGSGLLAGWGTPEAGIYRMPSDVDLDRLEREFLYTGEYVLYCGTGPIEPAFWSRDWWGMDSSTFASVLSSRGVAAAVIPFADDIEWRVLLLEADH